MKKNLVLSKLPLILTVLLLFLVLKIPSVKIISAAAATVIQWNFEDQNAIADNGISENISKIIARESGYAGSYTYSAGESSSNAISTSNWIGIKYWVINFSTEGYENLTLSSKMRSSSTGPKNFVTEYSLDGAIWVEIPGTLIDLSDSTWKILININLPVEINDQDTVYIRWLASGAEGTAGTNRIDDIVISGEEIITPTPTEIPTPTMTLTPTPTETPTPTPTEIPIPTSTSMPTEVPTPSPTAPPTEIPAPEFGSISGFKYFDFNKNNKWDGWFRSEYKMNGWMIFIDKNNNQKFDWGERFTFTRGWFFYLRPEGKYYFGKLKAGNYNICEVQLPGWESSLTDHNNCQSVIVGPGENIIGINFGDHLIRRK